MENIINEEISEKKRKFMELLCDYSEMGEKIHAMAKELGLVDKEKISKELGALLGAEFWVFQIYEVKHPVREDYIVHIERKIPIEKETGKPEDRWV